MATFLRSSAVRNIDVAGIDLNFRLQTVKAVSVCVASALATEEGWNEPLETAVKVKRKRKDGKDTLKIGK